MEGLIVIQNFVLMFSIMGLFGIFGLYGFGFYKIFKVLDVFSKRYIPVEGFNVEIYNVDVERILDEYKYLVADFPKLMKFIQKQFKMKASLMEGVIYEIIQEAEEEGLVASTLKSAVSEMLAGDDSSEREVKFLDQEFPVTNEDTLERNQERSKKSEVDRKFLLKRGEVVNL